MNEKTYTIKINGLQESISAVESLNKQLDNLEKRMNAVNATKMSSPSGGGGGRSSNVSVLSEEEVVQKEINKLKAEGQKLDAKIAATQDEIYKRVDATKQLLKETIADQKAIAAQERLTADAYSNTMAGMKAKLADIKAVINTTDLGDGDTIKKLTKEADELNSKLLEIEKSYGQFGRNVGNYASAAEGFKGLSIQVGDTVQKFDTAKQALKELSTEMKTLSAKKDLGLISEDELKRLQELIPVVAQLQSSIQDAGKPMDELMDAMQSFVAITQSFKGLGAFFGMDNDEVEKTIKNLVALQNAMQGLQTIQKQINTREGVGKWIAPFTTGIDKATKRLLTYNTTLLGTGKASKVAAVGVKAFSSALKLAVSAGILLAVDLLVEGIMELVEAFNKADEAAENAKKVQEEGAKAYAEGAAKIALYKQRVESFNGTKSQEKKLVEEFNKELGEGLGTYKSISEVQKALIEKSDAYCEALRKEAEAQALLNLYTEAYVNLQRVRMANAAGENDSWWRTRAGNEAHRADVENAAQKDADVYWSAYLAKQKELEQHNKDNKLFDYSDQVEKGGKKTKDAIQESENELAKTRISAMKEGLNKTILQLNEERKQRIAKLKANGKQYAELEKQWNEYYNDRILEATEEWSIKMNKVYSDLYTNIASYTKKNLEMVATETTKELERSLKKAEDLFGNFSKSQAGYSNFGGKHGVTSQIALGMLTPNKSEAVKQVKEYIDLQREVTTASANYIREMFELEDKKNSISKKEYEERRKQLKDEEAYWNERAEMVGNFGKEIKEEYGGDWFNETAKRLYEEAYSDDISSIFDNRIATLKLYWNDVERITRTGAEKEKKARLEVLAEAQKEEDAANLAWRDKSIQDTKNYYNKLIEGLKAQRSEGIIGDDEYSRKSEEAEKQRTEALLKINEEYYNRINALTDKYESERLEIEKNYASKTKKVTIDELEDRLQEMRDFQTAINDRESKQPVMNVWGMTNWKETKKNNQEIKDSYIELAKELAAVRSKALKVLADDKAPKEFKEQAESVIREANNMASGIGDALDDLDYKMSNWAKTQTFFTDIQMYLQEIASSFNQIMQAVWSYQDNVFDDEQDEIDKANDELEKALDKQQQIVEDHKNAIESIEDELAKARGSRRQHLIDQLNAEMAAQREAAAQEKKIQQQKEAQQKKQDELDRKRKKAQYQRDMMQAVVNGAMAVTYAAVNAWPIPAIPMMALAAATTAAQLAIMSSNKPYAKGGQLDGPSHREGGIKVPGIGGGIELEGQEYVIRKKTTNKNVDLLDYINKSEKKLTLDDFIDFYGTKARRTIKSISPKGKYADGGMIPTLSSNNIDINDKLISALEAYNERDVVVSVVDINNRQNQVKNVQVLAGLTE